MTTSTRTSPAGTVDARLKALFEQALAADFSAHDPRTAVIRHLLNTLKDLPQESLNDQQAGAGLDGEEGDASPPSSEGGTEDGSGGDVFECVECGRRFDSAIGLTGHVNKTRHGRQQLHSETRSGG